MYVYVSSFIDYENIKFWPKTLGSVVFYSADWAVYFCVFNSQTVKMYFSCN